MRAQHRLDLGGRHVLAAGDDDVLHPPGEEEVAVGVAAAEVAGVQPAVADGGGGGAGIAMVAAHHRRAADQDLALVTRRREHAVGPTDGDLHVGIHATDGAFALEDAAAARHEHAVRRLGLPVRLDHLRLLEEIRERPLGRHRRRRAAHAHLADRASDGVGNAVERDDVEDHAADERQIRDPEALRPFQHRGDLELLQQHGAGAEQHAAEEMRDQHRHVGERAHAQPDAVGVVTARLRAGERRPEKILVRQDDALGRARRARGVGDGGDGGRRRRVRCGRARVAAATDRRRSEGQIRLDHDRGRSGARRGLACQLRARCVGKQQARARVREQAGSFRGRGARGDRHHDGAQAPEREQRGDQAGLVAGEDADRRPRPDTVTGEPEPELVRRARQLAERQGSAAKDEAPGRAAARCLQAQEGRRGGQEGRDGSRRPGHDERSFL